MTEAVAGLDTAADILTRSLPEPEPRIARLAGDVAEDWRTESRRPLKILMLEDNPVDAELITHELAKAGLNFSAERVDTREGFIDALRTIAPDVVLLDNKLPGYSGAEALAHERRVHPEIPVVIVTGTIGDEAAIGLLKAGAKDYVLKSNLVRLPAAVERVIAIEQGIRARKSAEQAVRESEAKFRAFTTAAPHGIVCIDAADRVTYWNPAAERTFGYTAEEAMGRKFHGWLVPMRFRPAASTGLREFVKTGQGPFVGKTVELTALRKDGVEIPVELSVGAVPIGTEWHAIGILQDISARKRAEERLREEEGKFRGLVEQEIAGIYIIAADSTLAYVNPRFAAMAGYKAEEVIGRPVLEFIVDAEKEAVRKRLAAHISGNEPSVQIATAIERKDGTSIDVLAHGALATFQGQAASVGVILDITELKRAQAALRSSEERFRLLAEHAPDAILLHDVDQARFIAANRAAERLFACSRDEIFKHPPQHFYAPEQPDARPVAQSVADHIKRALAGEELTFERRIRNARGAERLCEVTIVRLPSTDSSLLRASYVDVTERKEAESALRRMNRTMRTLSAGNEALVRAASEQDLLDEMCRVIVETGGYRMAWIGVPQLDEKKIVKPVAWAGPAAEYFAGSPEITWGDAPTGQGVCGRAIRRGEPQTSQNSRADPGMAPWLAEFTKYGLASATGLPLKDDSGVFAVLAIYAAEPEAFNVDEIKLLQELANDLAFGIRSLREHSARETLERRWRASLETTVGAIASTVEMRDPYTAGHQQRVAKLAIAIARRLSMPDHDVHGLYLAGIIHDVGKINIPAEILNKPGKLSPIEFQLIRAHPQAGYDIVKGVDFPWPIAQMVLQHHERLDGSGYPQGLEGDAILREAKILAVADVVEAMMSHRPYRPALGTDAALAEIQNGKRTLFDPEAVDACVALFREDGFHFD